MAMGFLVAAALLLLAAGILGVGVWAFPLAGLAAIGLVVALVMGSRGSGAGAMERSKRPEPTGNPRPSHAAGDTANERQGQV